MYSKFQLDDMYSKIQNPLDGRISAAFATRLVALPSCPVGLETLKSLRAERNIHIFKISMCLATMQIMFKHDAIYFACCFDCRTSNSCRPAAGSTPWSGKCSRRHSKTSRSEATNIESLAALRQLSTQTSAKNFQQVLCL